MTFPATVWTYNQTILEVGRNINLFDEGGTFHVIDKTTSLLFICILQ